MHYLNKLHQKYQNFKHNSNNHQPPTQQQYHQHQQYQQSYQQQYEQSYQHPYQSSQQPYSPYQPTEFYSHPKSSSKALLPHFIELSYINRIQNWWPPEKLAAGLGVPKYANKTNYNILVLAFWTYTHGPLDTALIWADPVKYFGGESEFGTSKEAIQKQIKSLYHSHGILLMVSAFGATEFPTTLGINPIQCAEKLSCFVIENNLDGVDIDWEDNTAMENGTGEQWIIEFHTELRKRLPQHIISHAPQAPYFSSTHYKNGGYLFVDKRIGQSIDFYNVQFYNQESTGYDSYRGLFIESDGWALGTSVGEILKKGVHPDKIVVGKPVGKGDAYNSGCVDLREFGQWMIRAKGELGWKAGVMLWQYGSDLKGEHLEKACCDLRKFCN